LSVADSHVRNHQSRQKEDRPSGRYISGVLVGLTILSLLGTAVTLFLSGLGLPFVVYGVVSVVGFTAVWAVLKNLRELNAALKDECRDSERG